MKANPFFMSTFCEREHTQRLHLRHKGQWLPCQAICLNTTYRNVTELAEHVINVALRSAPA